MSLIKYVCLILLLTMKSMITLLFLFKKLDILLDLSWQGPSQLKCNS